MKKIPKGLDDKAMLQGYQEEESLHDIFERKEREGKQKRNVQVEEQESRLERAGLSSTTIETLARELLQLRMDLFADGVKEYKFVIKRQGHTVQISAE